MNNRTEDIVNWTFSGITMYYRDSNLTQEVIDKYRLKKIFRSKTFVDVTNIKSKPVLSCRFLIASCKAAPLYKFNPATEKWGLHTINCNSYFKVLDVYKQANITQILLLHIPIKGVDYFSQETQETAELEQKLILEAKNDFIQNINADILPGFQDQEWIGRTNFPLGVDNSNEFFSIDITEPLLPMAKPLYDAIKRMTNDVTDLNDGSTVTVIQRANKAEPLIVSSEKEKRSLFSRLFSKKEDKSEEKRTFSTTMMDESALNNLKVGDTITLSGDRSNDTPKYPSVWIEADANPYRRRIFDCREYAIKMITSTKNQELVSSFLASRDEDGKAYIGKFPLNGVKCEVDLKFDTKGKQLPDGILFKAKQMEEKWDIYKHANYIFYVRSWTRELVYFSNYIPTNTGFRVNLVVLDENRIHKDDPFFEFKVVEFLIYSHILNYQIPHPLPKSLEDNPDKILGFSYSMFGNRGYFGSYD